MPISSLIVQADEDRTEEVLKAIGEIDGAEVLERKGTNIVTITETKTQDEDEQIFEMLKNLPGVIGVSLVYHNFEDLNQKEIDR